MAITIDEWQRTIKVTNVIVYIICFSIDWWKKQSTWMKMKRLRLLSSINLENDWRSVKHLYKKLKGVYYYILFSFDNSSQHQPNVTYMQTFWYFPAAKFVIIILWIDQKCCSFATTVFCKCTLLMYLSDSVLYASIY